MGAFSNFNYFQKRDVILDCRIMWLIMCYVTAGWESLSAVGWYTYFWYTHTHKYMRSRTHRHTWKHVCVCIHACTSTATCCSMSICVQWFSGLVISAPAVVWFSGGIFVGAAHPANMHDSAMLWILENNVFIPKFYDQMYQSFFI